MSWWQKLDELADHIHPDVINQFCDGVQEMQKDRLEKAKALGFATVDQMHAHEAWLKRNREVHQAAKAFQATPEARKMRNEASMPPDTWVCATFSKPS